MRFFILLIVLILPPQVLLAQETFQKQKNQLFVYNIGVGGFLGGVGSLINKNKGENGFKVFFKGFGQGILGGFINYQSKNISHLIAKRKNLHYGWAAKFTQSIGASIIENAAANRNLWESYHFNYGPLRFQVDQQNAFKPSVKIAPGALVGLIWMGTKGRFDFKTSIQSGSPVFLSDGVIPMFGDTYDGFVIAGSMAYNKNELDNYELFAHEYIHILQYDDYIGFNSYFNSLTQKSSFFRYTEKFVYYDFHMPVWSLIVLRIRNSVDSYFENWFEFEAEHFATKRFVIR